MRDKRPVYSICITNYNTIASIRQSLESLLSQTDERFEVIVVDNKSSDGSLSILKEYESTGKIRLITRLCSRGLGRRIAIKNSHGKYIISQMDMDDVFEPRLNQLLEIYHKHFEGYLLQVQGIPGMMIAPRSLIDEVGGYRDLNWLEDRDLYSRVAQLGYFRFLKSFRIIAYTIKRRSPIKAIPKMYFHYREKIRTGQGFGRWKPPKNPVSRIISYVIVLVAFATHWFYPSVHNEFIYSFDEENYIVNLEN